MLSRSLTVYNLSLNLNSAAVVYLTVPSNPGTASYRQEIPGIWIIESVGSFMQDNACGDPYIGLELPRLVGCRNGFIIAPVVIQSQRIQSV
jgi:hypothetical protein